MSKELTHEINKVWENMKTILDRQSEEIKSMGEAKGETKETIEKMNNRLDEIEKEVKAKNRTVAEDKVKEQMSEKQAFLQFCRKGYDRLSDMEKKTLTISNDTTAGYLVPDEMSSEIIKNIVEFSPVRSVAKVSSIGTSSLKIVRRTGESTSGWVAEIGTKSSTQGSMAYGIEDIPTHELYSYVPVSNALLEDSAFDLNAELNQEFAEQFALAEGTAFVSGNAIGRPEGILTNSNVGEVANGHASVLQSDGLIALFYNIKTQYARNSVWMMERATIKTVRQLKSADGEYLWTPNKMDASNPSELLGRPVIEAEDMPTVAANAYPIVFGDFKQGYQIVDRIMMDVKRDDLTDALSGTVRFIARRRVGGQVIKPEAIKKLKIATSV